MTTQFKDRAKPAASLATRLTSFANRSDVLVLALASRWGTGRRGRSRKA